MTALLHYNQQHAYGSFRGKTPRVLNVNALNNITLKNVQANYETPKNS